MGGGDRLPPATTRGPGAIDGGADEDVRGGVDEQGGGGGEGGEGGEEST